MIDKCISEDIFNNIFKEHSIKIAVFLRGSKTTSITHDPFRNLGYVKVKKNQVWLDGMIKMVSANSLIIREMGLTETGAMQVIIPESDVSFIRLSEKIEIKGLEYYAFNDAVGNKLQIFDLPFGYKKVIIFRRDK